MNLADQQKELEITQKLVTAKKELLTLEQQHETQSTKGRKASSGHYKTMHEGVDKQIKLIKHLRDQSEKAEKEHKEGSAATAKQYKELADEIESLATKSNKAYVAMGHDFKSLNKAIEANIDLRNKAIDAQVKLKKMTGEQASREKVIQVRKAKEEFLAKQRPDLHEKFKEVVDTRSGKMAQGVGGDIKGLFSPKTMAASAKSLKGYGEAAKIAGMGSTVLTAGITALGKSLMGLMTSNPIGLLITAIMGLVAMGKKIIELDQFIKTMHKDFLKIAGPTGGFANTQVAMKKFTDSMYNLKEQLRLGMKAAQRGEALAGFGGGGMSMQGVQKQMGDYDKAIEQARVISLQFGVDTAEAAEKIADQMLNLRASLKDVREGFDEMSYDASQAGVSSQKFYQVVEAASSSLSYFGNFIKYTSGQLRELTKTGIMGFKDAAEQVQNLMGVFKGMDITKRMGLIALVGEGTVRKLYKKEENAANIRLETQKKIIKSERDAAKATKDPEEKKRHMDIADAEEKKLDSIRSDVRRLRRGAGGDLAQMAMNLPMLSKDINRVLIGAVNAAGVDFFDNTLAATKVMENVAGISQETANKMITQAQDGLAEAEDFATDFGSEFEKSMGAANDSVAQIYKDDMSGLFDDLESGKTTWEDFGKRMMDDLKNMGFSDKMAKGFTDMAQKNPMAAKMMFKSAKSYKGSTAILKEATLESMTNVPEMAERASEEQTDQLIQQTTSIQDMLDIDTEGVKYALAANKIQGIASVYMGNMAQGVGKLVGFVQALLGIARAGKKPEFEKQVGGTADFQKYKQESKTVEYKKQRMNLLASSDKKEDKDKAETLRKEIIEEEKWMRSFEEAHGDWVDVIKDAKEKIKEQAKEEFQARTDATNKISEMEKAKESASANIIAAMKKQGKIVDEIAKIEKKRDKKTGKLKKQEQDQLDKLGAEYDKMDTIINTSNDDIDKYDDEIDSAKKTIGKLDDSMADLLKATKELALQERLKGLSPEQKKSYQETMDKLAGIPEKVRKGLEKATPEQDRIIKEATEQTKKYTGMDLNVSDTDMINDLSNNIDQLNDPLIDNSGSVRAMTKALDTGLAGPGYRAPASGMEGDTSKGFKPVAHDWKSATGDTLVDSDALSKGMKFATGQLVDSLLKPMTDIKPPLMGGGNGMTNNWGGFNLTFESPVNGKPEDFKKMILDACSQIVENRMYDAMKRTTK